MDDFLQYIDVRKMFTVENYYKDSKNVKPGSILNYNSDIDYKYRYETEILQRVYHHLFDDIDWELKLNEPLNDDINELEAKKEIFNFSLKNYFYKVDKAGRASLDQQQLDEAVLFFRDWPIERQKIEKEIQLLNSKKHFKFVSKKYLQELNRKIQLGDAKYEKLEAIFEMETNVSSIDKNALKKEIDELNEKVNKVVDDVVSKHVIEVLKRNPDIILAKRLFRDNFKIYSTLFLSDEHNKNVGKYFDDDVLKEKLDKIYVDYIKQRFNLEKIEDKILQ